jgi:flagellar motor switch protein FliM
MAMNDVLSQDEVDSLFDDDDGPAPETDSTNQGPRPYDLAKQERIVRGRMPTLEIIHERFARNCRLGLFNFLRRTPEIAVGQVRVLKYSAFLRELVLPTNFNIMQLRSLRGSALFVFEPTLVFGVVEILFGGDGKIHTRIEGREFTLTESRIIQKLLEIVRAEYTNAWAPVMSMKIDYVRSEMQPQFANIATPSEVVVTTKFDIEIGHAQGAFHMCMPYASIEPIRDMLLSSTQADTGEPDHRWVGLLSRQVQTAEVDLVATLTTRRATLRQVLNMRPGDVVPIHMNDMIQAHVDNVPLFECRAGSLNGHYALRVEQVISRPNEVKPIGDANV